MKALTLAGWLALVGTILSCGGKPQGTGMRTGFDMEGHRGCRGLMPENTIPAMYRAIDLGVTTLELDVVITADDQALVSHDPFFAWEISTTPEGRTFTAQEQMSYNIFKMTAEEVSRWDVGSRPHPYFPRQQKMKVAKPLLRDLIDSVEQYCKTHHRPAPQYNIETKIEERFDGTYNPGPQKFTDLLMAVVKEKGIGKRVIIQSFDPRTLRIVREQYKGMRTSLLVDGQDKRNLEQQLADLGFIPDIYSPEQHRVDTLLVKACHEKGIAVIPWTVNDKASIDHLRALGVDGVITDYPDLFNSQIR